jgi:predicted membrane protein
MQMIIGSLIPFILLAIVVMMNRYLHDRLRNTLVVAASLLLLIQVFAMRWNVVIGGQLLSKSFRGLRSGYEPHLFDREGILVAFALFVLPFVLLYLFDRVLPIESPAEAHAPPPAAPPEAGHVAPGQA